MTAAHTPESSPLSVLAYRALGASTAVVAVCTVVVSLRGGVLLTPDGAIYQSAAVSLSKGRGYLDYTGSEVSVYPPGTSVLLALLACVAGLSMATAWKILLAVSFGAYAVAAWWLSSMLCIRRWAALIAFSAGLFLGTSTYVFRTGLSDAPFAAISALWLAIAVRSLMRTKTNTREIVLLLALASGSFLFRYSGVVLLGASIVLVARVSRLWRCKFAALLVSGLVPLAVLLWNLSRSGRIAGERLPSSTGPIATTKAVASSLVKFMAAPPAPIWLAVGCLMMLVGATIGLRAWRVACTPDLVFLSVFSVAYSGFIAMVAATVPMNQPDSRLLFPVVLPLLLLVVAAFNRLLVTADTGGRAFVNKAWGRVLISLTVLVVTSAAIASARLTLSPDHSIWTAAALAERIRSEIGPDEVVHSNAPDVLWVHTGRVVLWAPIQQAYASGFQPAELENFVSYVACRSSVVLVWFLDPPHSGFVSLNDLRARLDLRERLEFDGGLVFDVHSRGDSVPRCYDGRTFGSGVGVR